MEKSTEFTKCDYALLNGNKDSALYKPFLKGHKND